MTWRNIWYRHPNFTLYNGIKSLNYDEDVLTFAEYVKGDDTVDVFMDYLIHILIMLGKLGYSINIRLILTQITETTETADLDLLSSSHTVMANLIL